MKQKKHIIIALVIAILLCAALYIVLRVRKKPPAWTPSNALIPTHTPKLSDTRDPQPLVTAVNRSLEYFEKKEPLTPLTFGPHFFTVRQVTAGLKDFKAKLQEYGLTEEFFDYVRQNYTFYKSASPSVLFTGYYEALLKGSLEKNETYTVPLYKKPDDLVKIDLSQFRIYQKIEGLPKILRGRLTKEKRVVPYYSREEIDGQQALAGKGLEMIWIDDPVDVFFLQIQGSGVVELENGQKIRVNYADSNGHTYRAIGRLLLQQGALERENISMQSIRKYLKDHPDEMDEIFNYNPSYVFFRETQDGPIGSLGVPVTAFRSIATDKNLLPRGGLCYMETELPVFDDSGNINEWKRFSGFVLNQDTGGAIRTPRRVDLFTGHGKQSELTAGHMKREGMFYFLIKHAAFASSR